MFARAARIAINYFAALWYSVAEKWVGLGLNLIVAAAKRSSESENVIVREVSVGVKPLLHL